MKPGLVHTPGPLQGTIGGATHIQTPSQAEYGLGGRRYFPASTSDEWLGGLKGGGVP